MSSQPTPTGPFPDLADESFDEAAFLWQRWEQELVSPTRSLAEIYSWTEDRLHGSLDGVRLSGARAVDVASKELQSEDIDRVTVATAVLASIDERGAPDAIASALRTAEGKTLDAMLRALELLGSENALRAAASAFQSPAPHRAAALCRLKVFRRVPSGEELASAFASPAPADQVSAIRAARQLTPDKAERWIVAGLQSEDAGVRYAAIESGLCLRVDQAWKAAADRATKRSADAGPYLKLLALFGKVDEQEVVFAALRIPELQTAAVWALGHIGTHRAAEACIAGMRHEQVARACGEAYCWMTGADLERDNLAIKETLPDAPDFEDDDLDANLVPTAESLWPMPNPEAVEQHWLSRKAEWSANVRHVQGHPIAGDTMLTTMETGPMLRRPDLALELHVKTRGRYDVETRAFTGRQRQMMAAGRAAVAAGGGR